MLECAGKRKSIGIMMSKIRCSGASDKGSEVLSWRKAGRRLRLQQLSRSDFEIDRSLWCENRTSGLDVLDQMVSFLVDSPVHRASGCFSAGNSADQ